jgi:ribosome recycling factor
LKEAEGARVAARQIRRSAMDTIKKRKSDMSTDDFKRLEKDIQKLTDEGIGRIDKAADEKARGIGGD